MNRGNRNERPRVELGKNTSGDSETNENTLEREALFEKDNSLDPVDAERVKMLMTEKERNMEYLTEEQRERFVLDYEANKKLMGVFNNAIVEERVRAFRQYLLDNPEYVGKTKEGIQGLSEELIRDMMEGDKDKVIEIASQSVKYAELMHLKKTLEEAEGNLNYNEKMMFLYWINKNQKVVEDPALLKELKVKLWEAKEGEKIDDKAREMMEKKGFVSERDKYTREKVEDYKTSQLIEAMWIKEEIDEIRRDGNIPEEEKTERIKEVIEEKKKEIKKTTGMDWSDGEIIALSKQGCDFTPAKWQFTDFFTKKFEIKVEDKIKRVSLEELKKIGKKESLLVVGDLANHEKEAGEEWDSKFESIKEEIIEGACNEIPHKSVERVYEKYKRIRLFDKEIASRIKNDKEKGRKLSELFGNKKVEMGKIASELYDCDNDDAGFDAIIRQLPEKDLFRTFIEEKRGKGEALFPKKGKRRHWFGFLDLLFEYIGGQSQK